MGVIIKSVSSYHPDKLVTNQEIEKKVSETFPLIPIGILEQVTGVKTRYFACDGEYASTFAIKAGEKCIEKSELKKEEIDLLIFASASQDIIEPATGNIVQNGLGLDCPTFDVKNACNSFMNGIDIADSFIKSGKYKNILICSGEVPSKAIQFKINSRMELKKYFAAYTFGDAGSAMILSQSEDNSGIQDTYLFSDGSSWKLGTIMGGGSRFPHEDVSYFVGDPEGLRDKFKDIEMTEFNNRLEKLGWKKEEITRLFVHQVAMSNFEYMQELIGIPIEKFEIILPEYGNIASCCIPTSFDKYCGRNELKKGDKFIFIGLASGFSYSLIFYEV